MTSQPATLVFRNVKGGDFRATAGDVTYRVRKVGEEWRVLTQRVDEGVWVQRDVAASKEAAQGLCEQIYQAVTVVAEVLKAENDRAIAALDCADEVDHDEPGDTAADGSGIEKELRLHCEERRRIEQALDDSDEKLRTLVVAAFGLGLSVRPIMDATGLSKSRVYQIRDGRR